MPRSFAHISQIEIREVIAAVNAGEPKAHIARRLSIDRKTIYNHLRKYEQSCPERGNVYALVKTDFRKLCAHPSLKCSLCGQHKDAIQREERKTISQLKSQLQPIVCREQIELIGSLRLRLADAHLRLERAGLPVE